ncbi:hypothetical protein LCGC14_2747090 [marine sediment metagenome]|uniref:Uncharacterized protein n=1 Tax=marine sediment metagenome TaxID=412755 RepID=A0A0F9BBM7_9ZZZZ
MNNETLKEIKEYVKDKTRLFKNSTDDRGKSISEVLTNIQHILDKKGEPNTVFLTVNGGVVNLETKPFGVGVEIRDYDVEGLDVEGDERCKKDSDGDWYQEMVWEPAEEIE